MCLSPPSLLPITSSNHRGFVVRTTCWLNHRQGSYPFVRATKSRPRESACGLGTGTGTSPRPTRLAQHAALSDHLLTTMITSVPRPLVTRQLLSYLHRIHSTRPPFGVTNRSPSQGAAEKCTLSQRSKHPAREVSRAGACHDLQKVPSVATIR